LNDTLYVDQETQKAHKKLVAKKKREAKQKKDKMEKLEKENPTPPKVKQPDDEEVGTIFSTLDCPDCGPIDEYALFGTVNFHKVFTRDGSELASQVFWKSVGNEKYRCNVCGEDIAGNIVS